MTYIIVFGSYVGPSPLVRMEITSLTPTGSAGGGSVGLRRLLSRRCTLRSGAQTGAVRLWQEEASIVLRTLGVPPPDRPRPTHESEDFDPEVELGRTKDEGESKLKKICSNRQRIDESVKSIDLAEEIIRLEAEESSLTAQLSKP